VRLAERTELDRGKEQGTTRWAQSLGCSTDTHTHMHTHTHLKVSLPSPGQSRAVCGEPGTHLLTWLLGAHSGARTQGWDHQLQAASPGVRNNWAGSGSFLPLQENPMEQGLGEKAPTCSGGFPLSPLSHCLLGNISFHKLRKVLQKSPCSTCSPGSKVNSEPLPFQGHKPTLQDGGKNLTYEAGDLDSRSAMGPQQVLSSSCLGFPILKMQMLLYPNFPGLLQGPPKFLWMGEDRSL
jgi:hypothetical protein